MTNYSDVGCPALDRRAQHCHTACRDARMAGESRLCEGSEYDPCSNPPTRLRAETEGPSGQCTISARGTDMVKCGGCEQNVYATFESQSPAPCGCNWTWEHGYLIASPRR